MIRLHKSQQLSPWHHLFHPVEKQFSLALSGKLLESLLWRQYFLPHRPRPLPAILSKLGVKRKCQYIIHSE
jgi:hypothetical protein